MIVVLPQSANSGGKGRGAEGISPITEHAYDPTNQLTGAAYAEEGLTDESYSYDANGNRTGGGYETGLNNQLASDGTYNYSYDANGNRTGGGYQTGLNNQLTSDGTYTYLYDAEGNRIRRTKIADGSYSQYFYDHRNRLTGVQDVTIIPASLDPNGSGGTP